MRNIIFFKIKETDCICSILSSTKTIEIGGVLILRSIFCKKASLSIPSVKITPYLNPKFSFRA